jgi:hypothetical protein
MSFPEIISQAIQMDWRAELRFGEAGEQQKKKQKN